EANAGLFYRNGRPVTVAELSATLERGAAAAGAVTGPAPATAAASAAVETESRAAVFAARLDHVRRDEMLAGLLSGKTDGMGLGSLVDAQLLGAFVGREKA